VVLPSDRRWLSRAEPLLLWNERREPQTRGTWRTIFMVALLRLVDHHRSVAEPLGALSLRCSSARSCGNYQTVVRLVENSCLSRTSGHATGSALL